MFKPGDKVVCIKDYFKGSRKPLVLGQVYVVESSEEAFNGDALVSLVSVNGFFDVNRFRAVEDK